MRMNGSCTGGVETSGRVCPSPRPRASSGALLSYNDFWEQASPSGSAHCRSSGYFRGRAFISPQRRAGNAPPLPHRSPHGAAAHAPQGVRLQRGRATWRWQPGAGGGKGGRKRDGWPYSRQRGCKGRPYLQRESVSFLTGAAGGYRDSLLRHIQNAASPFHCVLLTGFPSTAFCFSSLRGEASRGEWAPAGIRSTLPRCGPPPELSAVPGGWPPPSAAAERTTQRCPIASESFAGCAGGEGGLPGASLLL